MRKRCGDRGVEIPSCRQEYSFSVEEDLIGEIWKNRPELSCEPVMELEEKWAGKSRADKCAQIREKWRKKAQMPLSLPLLTILRGF